MTDHDATDADRYSDPLTAREQEILGLLTEGRSTKFVAGKLFISLATVRNHVQSIMQKLGAHTRLEAVAIARRAVADPGSRLIRLGRRDGMNLTDRQKGAIRQAFVPPPVAALPAQPDQPVIEGITVSITNQQKMDRG